MRLKGTKRITLETIAVILSIVIFWVPFFFVILNSLKNKTDAALLDLSWPSSIQWSNYTEVLTAQDHMVIRSFINSTLITLLSIVVLIIVSAMTGYVLQRRNDRWSGIIQFLVMAGLMIPPAVVPTIWVLDSIHLFKTMTGIVLVEVALGISFAVMLFRSFMATIPREIDEAAVVDGCGSLRMFFQIIFPLLMPVTSTVVVLSSVGIYNDFVNPLYFFPGAKNATIQLTLYNFTSMYNTSWNLLFADIILISIPPLILFIFFNKRIVAGMTAGAVKG
ncbi:raffinose/stachyose/melibiose transport system permease protein [Paenibacillus cellulosilyticus]|uniref:Raffinose/stachyose/melibiose transport system permease protein n=1 Tax=Paenibacillus cellulosilyticus TaxID=375489 RepID=A0A2V2YSA4_9BACL|nr:carbohydrate ABC transporter permease [Paenibacillus cellulosilyticus]PWW00940.1 raffinose/stachyose/melibiose transport system permease protein [Paenibacillus cellulosilyticus]QKS47588.1 carbohydrate ABC transporter permease [Paenibacillus cellulosilyticus]